MCKGDLSKELGGQIYSTSADAARPCVYIIVSVFFVGDGSYKNLQRKCAGLLRAAYQFPPAGATSRRANLRIRGSSRSVGRTSLARSLVSAPSCINVFLPDEVAGRISQALAAAAAAVVSLTLVAGAK